MLLLLLFSYFLIILIHICSYEYITPRVSYNFLSNKATLKLTHKLGYDFEIISLDLEYAFGKFKLPEREIMDINAKEYAFSVKHVPRHVFHPEFSCSIEYKLMHLPELFKVAFQFNIPFFQSSTTISFTKLESYEIPEELQNRFPDEKKLIKYVK
jgi:hypothetical protein